MKKSEVVRAISHLVKDKKKALKLINHLVKHHYIFPTYAVRNPGEDYCTLVVGWEPEKRKKA